MSTPEAAAPFSGSLGGRGDGRGGVADAYLTPAQVAELLQVSEKTVYRWASAPKSTMPMLKLGGTVRFPAERLMRWLRSREQGHPMGRQVRLVTKSAGSAAPPAPCAEHELTEGGT